MKYACLLSLCLCLNAVLCAQSNPVPFVDQPLMPASTAPGGPEFALTVNGGNFVTGSQVTWNGNPLTTQFVSKARLTATVLASQIAKSGTASVSVMSPHAPASNVVFFSVVTPVTSVAFTGSTFSTVNHPWQAVTGDFNRDGILDLAVSNWETNLAILLGNGDGTFQEAITNPAGGDSAYLATGDFNGDGNLDLAITNQSNASTVSILLGNGDGTFQPAVDYATGASPGAVVVGDFNGDGKLDLAIADGGDAYVSLLLGNGDGTFQAVKTLSLGGIGPICIGDFNGDGILDLAIAVIDFGTNSVAVSLGNGDGSFQPAVYYSGGTGFPQSLATTDLNGDGALDFAIGDWDGVTVLLGNGDGSFGAPTTYTTASKSYTNATIADLNGDGKPDIAVASQSPDTFAALLGNGDGTFQQPVYFQGGSFTQAITFGDFNRDGAMDLALAAYGYPGNNGGAFVSLQTNGPAVQLSPLSLTFPLQLYGTRSAPQKVQLANVGKQPLLISQINVQGMNPHDFVQTNNCGTSVAVGGMCTVKVVFAPTFKAERRATLVITDNALAPVQAVGLAGLATWIKISPVSLNFGNETVGTVSPPQTVTVTNVGTGAVKVSDVTISSDITWQVHEYNQTNDCNTLAAGASCTVNVTFAPTLKGRADKVDLWVHHDGGGKAQAVSLSGDGT